MEKKNIVWDKKKVCIIDDDDNIREIYQLQFRLEGFDVSVASNGEEGLQVVRATKPDIILLDLHMPVKTGLEFLEEVKKDKILAEIPVIVLTNIDDEETVKAIGKFQTHFYLIKSLTSPQKAVDYVREVL